METEIYLTETLNPILEFNFHEDKHEQNNIDSEWFYTPW
jgi:hypothetical protein